MKRLYTNAALATVLSMAAAQPLMSQEVTFQSFDGSIVITGRIVEDRGASVVLDSAIGPMEISTLEMRCIGDACPTTATTSGEVKIAGARAALQDMMPQLIEGYAFQIDAEPQVAMTDEMSSFKLGAEGIDQIAKIDVAMSNSKGGFEALRSGQADFIVSTRPAHADEDTIAKGEQVLALDGIVILTHPNNPVRALAERDIPEVFSGRIARWSDLGGFESAINIYVEAEDSGTMEVFKSQVMDPVGARLAANVTVVDSDRAVADAVAGDPFGIGVGSFSAQRNARATAIRGTCGVQTPANEFTIRTEDYPLTRRIYVYQEQDQLDGHAASLLDFALSDEGQFIVGEAGFVDQRVSAEPVDNQGIRLASAVMDNGTDISFRDLRDMMGNLVVGERLSLTYRFQFGSSTLDSRAVGDIERLAQLLSTGDYRNKDVLLVGFTDAIGDASRNRTLSQARASVVRDALINAAPVGSLDNIRIRTAGFGEAAPIVCNDTDAGRAINRRVEVWISDLVRTN